MAVLLLGGRRAAAGSAKGVGSECSGYVLRKSCTHELVILVYNNVVLKMMA
jgi:hypothetical protein